MASGRLIGWALLVAATLAMVLRAPIYVTEPSFWAEEGMLYFAVAWDRPLGEALTYRPAGYLLLCANLATILAARLVRAGLLPLAHAPQVTVLCALAVQLLPVALIAWSRAPFWDGALRRLGGVAIVLVGVLTDEIWLNTINCQPWLILAASLILLEPVASSRIRAWVAGAILALAGLSAPVVSVLAPLFVWRAWRTRHRDAIVQAAIVITCGLVQAGCVWAAVRSGQALPARLAGISPGVLAATIWMRTLVLPLFGIGPAGDLGRLIARSGGIGSLGALALLVLAGGLVALLARGLRAVDRLPLAGAYVLVTMLTLLTVAGDKGMLLRSPWASSRYVYAPGILILLMVLGGVRRDAGWIWPVLCGVVLALRLAAGTWSFPATVRWSPEWPRWPVEVRAWDVDPQRPLAIWPPPWRVTLSPAPLRAAAVVP